MTPITAQIVGADRCESEGFAVTAASPVLALCRRLVAAGYDPMRPLHAYRGGVLAVRVRSIGEGAKLETNGEGTGFRRLREPDAAPHVRQNEVAATQARAA